MLLYIIRRNVKSDYFFLCIETNKQCINRADSDEIFFIFIKVGYRNEIKLWIFQYSPLDIAISTLTNCQWCFWEIDT